MSLGEPREHHETIGSTNQRARELAEEGAAHGTLVTAGEQTAGRGRQGRTWQTPAGVAIAASLILRSYDELLPLRAGLAVADLAGPAALVKWPNDVLVDGRKVAGMLVEARPQEGWAVLGIGVNAAVDVAALPPELRETAGTLARTDLEGALGELLGYLDRRLAEPAETTLEELTRRDALLGRPLSWAGGEGSGAGIDAQGRLRVRQDGGPEIVLDAGEVHVR
jgi:BirA family transcriptional regulator, biotin operon repressor / biotin---[acetyl-CoA-carboxylase] ligase